jgi:hypothetical protein
MTQRRMFGHREYMVGGTHMSQNGIIIFQRGMQETCNIHNYVTYVIIYIYIWTQTIKLETFGTMMFRTLGTVIAFSLEPPLVSHWLIATVLETSPH